MSRSSSENQRFNETRAKQPAAGAARKFYSLFLLSSKSLSHDNSSVTIPGL